MVAHEPADVGNAGVGRPADDAVARSKLHTRSTFDAKSRTPFALVLFDMYPFQTKTYRYPCQTLRVVPSPPPPSTSGHESSVNRSAEHNRFPRQAHPCDWFRNPLATGVDGVASPRRPHFEPDGVLWRGGVALPPRRLHPEAECCLPASLVSDLSVCFVLRGTVLSKLARHSWRGLRGPESRFRRIGRLALPVGAPADLDGEAEPDMRAAGEAAPEDREAVSRLRRPSARIVASARPAAWRCGKVRPRRRSSGRRTRRPSEIFSVRRHRPRHREKAAENREGTEEIAGRRGRERP